MATSFTCAAVGCYSKDSPQTHEVFKELQSYLNRFARAVGFAPIGVDGVLGASSVRAAQAVSIAMSRSGASPQIVGAAGGWIAGTSTPQMLAQGAEQFLLFLKAAASEANLPVVAPPKPGVPATTTPAQPPTLPEFEDVNSKWKKIAYYVAGGLLGVGTLFVGYRVLNRLKSAV